MTDVIFLLFTLLPHYYFLNSASFLFLLFPRVSSEQHHSYSQETPGPAALRRHAPVYNGSIGAGKSVYALSHCICVLRVPSHLSERGEMWCCGKVTDAVLHFKASREARQAVWAERRAASVCRCGRLSRHSEVIHNRSQKITKHVAHFLQSTETLVRRADCVLCVCSQLQQSH